ncbi:MAG TPA: hypothetical protein P5232_03185 [Candidatus Moranbacteria bacterium]|nr:hypothetical protein [Candidatus Moranbacteria bacterium]
MNKYFLASIFLAIALVLAGCGSKETPAVDRSAGIIFFYGRECPHCKIVEDYIKENKISEKIAFAQGEVYHNKSNAEFMVEKAKQCGINTEEGLGVPFLWAEGKCMIGQEQAIQFFKDKAGS